MGLRSLLGRANPNPVVAVPLVGVSSSTDNIVTGVVGKKIKVLSFILTSTSALRVQFEDGVTNYTGDMEMDTGPVVAPHNATGWFTVAVGLGLDITITGLGSLDGKLTYVLVD